VAAALEDDASTDLAALINQFLQAGAFAALHNLPFEDA
jgi:hypothetical protein